MFIFRHLCVRSVPLSIDVVLGHLKSNRILASARIKRWWMAPCWPVQAAEVPIETQFLLCGLAGGGYALFLPLVSGTTADH